MLLFTYIITGALTATAIISLGNNFGDARLYIAAMIIGLAVSWWQEKKEQPIPHLKLALNIIFILLTIKALLPFFLIQGKDVVAGLIRTWIYFLILSTFTLYTKRDFYLIQVLSFGLLVFSSFGHTAIRKYLLIQILVFFILWVLYFLQ